MYTILLAEFKMVQHPESYEYIYALSLLMLMVVFNSEGMLNSDNRIYDPLSGALHVCTTYLSLTVNKNKHVRFKISDIPPRIIEQYKSRPSSS